MTEVKDKTQETKPAEPKPETKEEREARLKAERPSAWGYRTAEKPPDGWEEGYPKVYFSVYERWAPIVVKSSQEEHLIDKKFWIGMPVPPPAEEKEAKNAAANKK